MSEFVKAQQELRANLTEQIRDVIEGAEKESRGLDAAELEKIDRIEADIRKADETIAVAQRNEERRLEASVAAKGFVPSVSEARSTADIFRALARGEERNYEFTRSALTPSNNTVPKSFYDQVFDVARLVGPMLEVPEVINTTSGEDLTIPTLTAYSTATLTSAGGTVSASAPTYNSITLGAFKYGFLIQAANELVTDAGFDLASHLAQQAGNGIGYSVNSVLTTGDGSSKPLGIVPAAGSGITGGTAVTGGFTADNLIDLAYSVDGAVRRMPGAAFMANGATIGKMRKLKDTAGNYLYQVGVGYPDTFAGFRVIENPHLVDTGLSAKSVLFGDLSSYKVRVAGGIQVASSQDFAFNTDLTTWRFLIRLDGDITHSSHIKYFIGNAA
jgi:HK97 family phage major capsid protein